MARWPRALSTRVFFKCPRSWVRSRARHSGVKIFSYPCVYKSERATVPQDFEKRKRWFQSLKKSVWFPQIAFFFKFYPMLSIVMPCQMTVSPKHIWHPQNNTSLLEWMEGQNGQDIFSLLNWKINDWYNQLAIGIGMILFGSPLADLHFGTVNFQKIYKGTYRKYRRSRSYIMNVFRN